MRFFTTAPGAILFAQLTVNSIFFFAAGLSIKTAKSPLGSFFTATI
jgi:hypothetical protein